MIPFPGESMPIGNAWSSDGDDWTLVNDIVERALSRTISAGDEWRVWCYAGDQVYLEETGLALSISWVIEVLSGTATLVLTDGIDAAGDHDTGATLPNSLGTVNVTGAGTYVVTASFTGAEVETYATGELELRIQCTSGSCDVQQLKLRVWPAGGILGGYAPYPAWDQVTSGAVWSGTVPFNADGTGADTVAAWEDLRDNGLPAAASAFNAASHDVTLDLDSPTGNQGHVQSVLVELGTYGAGVADNPVISVILAPKLDEVSPIDPSLSAFVDYIYPPTEVFGDNTYLAIPGGTATLTWGEFGAQFDVAYEGVSGAPSTSPGGGLALTINAGGWPAGGIDEFSGSFEATGLTLTLSGGALISPLDDATPASTTVALGGGSSQAIYVLQNFSGDVTLPDFSSWFPNAVLSPTGLFDYAATFDEPLVTIHHPPYQLWNPAVVPFIPLRQLHRDDGYGVTPPRAFGGASRNHTNRAFGYD